jgi:hypothetical protein
MKNLIASVAAVAALALAGSAQAAQPSSPFTFPVTATSVDQGTFNGTFKVTKFAVSNGAVVAQGVVTGTLVDENGVTNTIIRFVNVPVILNDAARGTAAVAAIGCEVLHLELGPLDLDLLGLVVHLDRVVLDITAVPGAGNLLGNLLCAIVGLLDGSNLGQLANLLNQLLNLLGGLLG